MKDIKIYINQNGFTTIYDIDYFRLSNNPNPFFYMKLNNISKYQFNDRKLISRITDC